MNTTRKEHVYCYVLTLSRALNKRFPNGSSFSYTYQSARDRKKLLVGQKFRLGHPEVPSGIGESTPRTSTESYEAESSFLEGSLSCVSTGILGE